MIPRSAAYRLWFLPLLVVLLTLSLSGCILQQHDTSDLEEFIAEVKRMSRGRPLGPLPDVETYQPYPYDAGVLKDPFAYARFIVDVMTRQERIEADPLFTSGVTPDFDRPRERLENYELNALRMVGTFRDFTTNDLWALIRAPDGVVYRVREGNYVGQNHGEIYAISESGVDIQEIIRDPSAGGWRERENRLSLAP